MSATVVYVTVAYLAARLQKTRVARLATLAVGRRHGRAYLPQSTVPRAFTTRPTWSLV